MQEEMNTKSVEHIAGQNYEARDVEALVDDELVIKDMNVEECDATKFNSSNKEGLIKIITIVINNITEPGFILKKNYDLKENKIRH